MFETAVGDGSRVDVIIDIDDSAGAATALSETKDVPSGVEMEADHEYDDGEEDDNGGEHDFAADGVGFIGRRLHRQAVIHIV